MFQDLREYVDALEEHGLLKRIKAEVDWNLEMGAVTRLVCERREAAPLFENVRGYPGHRVLGVVMGPSRPALHARVAIALGADPDTHPLRLIELVREQISRSQPPVEVDRDSAACKEVVVPADQIDLLSLPVPWIKSVDGGRYVGPGDIVVPRHPDPGWLNWGVYRCMVVDGQSLAILLPPSGQPGGAILRRYQELDKPMPVAL